MWTCVLGFQVPIHLQPWSFGASSFSTPCSTKHYKKLGCSQIWWIKYITRWIGYYFRYFIMSAISSLT